MKKYIGDFQFTKFTDGVKKVYNKIKQRGE